MLFNRLYCTTLIANAEEKFNPSNSELHGAVTIANLELVECLFEMKDRKQQFVEVIVQFFKIPISK